MLKVSFGSNKEDLMYREVKQGYQDYSYFSYRDAIDFNRGIIPVISAYLYEDNRYELLGIDMNSRIDLIVYFEVESKKYYVAYRGLDALGTEKQRFLEYVKELKEDKVEVIEPIRKGYQLSTYTELDEIVKKNLDKKIILRHNNSNFETFLT